MGQLFSTFKVTNLVFFPFGMGAFLRNLYKLDPEYAEDGRVQLREVFVFREMRMKHTNLEFEGIFNHPNRGFSQFS